MHLLSHSFCNLGIPYVSQPSSGLVLLPTADSSPAIVASQPDKADIKTSSAQIVRIEQAPDGHFWVDGEINGHRARFMIDSGATITALSSDLAQSAGLNVDTAGPGVALRTANGAILAHRSSVGTLSVGSIDASDIGVVVSDAFGDMNVIGMNFLSRLRSWRVENGEMILEA